MVTIFFTSELSDSQPWQKSKLVSQSKFPIVNDYEEQIWN